MYLKTNHFGINSGIELPNNHFAVGDWTIARFSKFALLIKLL